MDSKVIDNAAQHRFELPVGEALAVAYYRIDDAGRVVLTHTEVPQELSGRGIGSRLAQGAFDLTRASGRHLIAQCPFMAAYAGRHPAYNDIVDG